MKPAKRLLIFLLLFILAKNCAAQKPFTLSKTDSLSLVETWNHFQKSFQSKDTSAIKSISMPEIHCNECIHWTKWTSLSNFVAIDTFLKQMLSASHGEGLHRELTNGVFDGIHAYELLYDSLDSNSRFTHDVIIAEVRLNTIPPGEIDPAHEGQDHFFQFILEKNRFRLYGLTSMP
jgi:hypothetical protein